MRERDVIWNNGFRHILTVAGAMNVKPIKFFSRSLPSYRVDERQLTFFSKL